MEWKIISLIGAIIISLITWSLNERSKRIYEEYKRKEEKYSKLIRALRGFYTSSFNSNNYYIISTMNFDSMKKHILISIPVGPIIGVIICLLALIISSLCLK